MHDSHLNFRAMNAKRLILIVEDEAVNREILGLTLSGQYEIAFAASGAEALDAIARHRERLSLVLLDLNLPDMHGMDILRGLKADEATARLPVIVLTSDREAEVESLTEGAIDFIPKPYPMPGVIQARVHRTIELCEDRDILRITERDQLTGLYNQKFFFHYVEELDLYRADLPMDAIVLDVNHFHMINERYGRACGDEVLRRVGARALELVEGEGGIVCRQGADTFFLYCPHRDDYAAMLDSICESLEDAGLGRARVRLRMGVYSGVDKSIDIERRFDRAWQAAGTVRGSYASSVVLYDDALHRTELFEERLLDSFQEAIQEKQFLVYFQPKFDVRPAEPTLCSAEALVRWNHPELGMISPGVFIPLFERNGLIPELDSYVWRETARTIRDWKDRLGVSVPVSVNVSRVDMYDDDFVANMLALIKEFGLAPGELLLEITESAYTENSDQIVEKVRQLREAGFRIEMDDFGTGYSSLNMLSSLPIDALKLDMQFIRTAFNGPRDTRMLDVVLEIADTLMVSSIAEGVETAEQMFALKAMGCDIVQGYYFSPPVPADRFELFLLSVKRAAGEAPAQAAEAPEPPRRRARGGQAHAFEAMHDPVTGLYNPEAFELLLRDAGRNRVALLLAEVDGLPDEARARERALRRVARVLRGSFRAVDFVCRLEDRRFAVLMTRADSSLNELVLEKIRQINERLSDPGEGDSPVSLRVGVSFADQSATGDSVLNAAKAALADGREQE